MKDVLKSQAGEPTLCGMVVSIAVYIDVCQYCIYIYIYTLAEALDPLSKPLVVFGLLEHENKVFKKRHASSMQFLSLPSSFCQSDFSCTFTYILSRLSIVTVTQKS